MPPTSPSILIIDDHADTLTLLSELFKKRLHINSVTAERLDVACDLIRNMEFDLVICDYHLPNESALDLVSTLKAEGCRTPIVFFTASSTLPVEAIRAINHPWSAIYKKDHKELLLAVGRHFGLKHNNES